MFYFEFMFLADGKQEKREKTKNVAMDNNP